jgi:hypothetical protein
VTRRPPLTPRAYVWTEPGPKETPGVGLWTGKGRIAAHLTYTEARTLADGLHDLCDGAGNPEPALPSTEAEQE